MKRKIRFPVVRDIEITKNSELESFCEALHAAGGFTAKKVGEAVSIIRTMFSRKNCVTFLSFPACIVATGTRGIIRTLVEKKLVDVLITTCGTLDHDFARTFAAYYHGDFLLDDRELHRKKIHRLGNVLIPFEHYGSIIEQKLQPMLDDICRNKTVFSTKEFIWALGEKLDPTSIMYWCWKNRIPMYVPGITDGAVGSQLWLFRQRRKDFNIDIFKDEQELADLVWKAKETGALIIGGGISKHHTIWWNQFRGGLDYAVCITTAEEYDGSLSGARLREGISWGKVKPRAKQLTIEGDATVLLPLIIGAVLQTTHSASFHDWVMK